jgi:hypothetical protein
MNQNKPTQKFTRLPITNDETEHQYDHEDYEYEYIDEPDEYLIQDEIDYIQYDNERRDIDGEIVDEYDEHTEHVIDPEDFKDCILYNKI